MEETLPMKPTVPGADERPSRAEQLGESSTAGQEPRQCATQQKKYVTIDEVDEESLHESVSLIDANEEPEVSAHAQ